MTRTNTIFTLILLATSFISSRSQTVTAQIDSIIAASFSEHQPGVATIVSQGDRIIYRKSRGLANLETALPLKPDDIFRIGSITKQFTAAAILDLARKQLLSLNDDVRLYIPEFLPSGPSISIEQLMNHTAGIKNYTEVEGWDEKVNQTDLSPTSIIDIFKDESLLFNPGTSFHYSNLGYTLLGHIIEVVSKSSYEAYLQDNFLDPLGMNHTRYYPDSSDKNSHPIGYSPINGGFKTALNIDVRIPYAAGGLQSNIDDLLTWHQYVFATKNESWLKQAHQPAMLATNQQISYGFGWQIGNIQSTKTIKHDGIIDGFVAVAIHVPASEVTVIMLSNSDAHRDIEIPASKIAALVMDKPFIHETIVLNANDLKDYSGIYQTPDGHPKHIIVQDNQLMLYDRGGTKTILSPVNKHTFLLGNSLNQIVFNNEDDRQILTMQTLNLPEEWIKVSEEVLSFQSIPFSGKEDQDVLGKYDMGGHFVLEVIEENGKIYGQVGPDRKEIKPYDTNKFFALDMDIRLIFNQGDQGEVNSVTMMQVHELTGQKIY